MADSPGKIVFAAFNLGLLLALSACLPHGLAARQATPPASDSLRLYRLQPIVITATRTVRELSESPVPVSVISRDEIERRGSARLADLLAELPGLNIVHEFGAGLQMQGLGSEYVLVLIDGEPVVGRSGGTLDLARLTVRGLERIEIVQGPSSSLYGSDALAGVVNLITAQPRGPIRAELSGRFETHSTLDTSLQTEFATGAFSATLLLNRYSSNGYDLFDELPGATIPGFVDHTFRARGSVGIGPYTGVRASTTFNSSVLESEQSTSGTAVGAPTASVGDQRELSALVGMAHRFPNGVSADVSAHRTRFVSTTSLVATDSRFEQRRTEPEVKLDIPVGTRHVITLGSGTILEYVESDRIAGRQQRTQSAFTYGQHLWTPVPHIEIVSSARFDYHGDFDHRLSPKLAVLFKPDSGIRVRSSVGSGFRAPTLRQRYLDFRNPTGGYVVFGAAGLDEALKRLEDEEELRWRRDDATSSALSPERSWSYNAGVDLAPGSGFSVGAGVFYNRVVGLIETSLVAETTGGQQIFSYENLDRIRTRGAEVAVGFEPALGIGFNLGYTYTDAVDLDVLEDVNDGLIFKRVNGIDRLVRSDEYGGLFRRSKHAATFASHLRFPRHGLGVSIRLHYRSRYGLVDRNGNLILDDAAEYVPGFATVNVTVTKDMNSLLRLTAGVSNALDRTDPELIPSMPGRLLFAGLSIQLN